MILEQAKREAIDMLLRMPSYGIEPELNIQRLEHDIWLGMGWLVARGWVIYGGDYHFGFSKEGRAHAARYINDMRS